MQQACFLLKVKSDRLEEYLKAPVVTRQRLYLETIERILPAVEKIVIDSESSGNLLQFLPLKDLGSLE